MSKNPAQKLIEFGQSVWYDNISRELLQNGELKRLIKEWGVRGLTSNPTIFDKALSGSNIYDSSIAKLKGQNLTSDQVFEVLAVEDIAEAADLLLPVYQESGGNDGFVSIEVSPVLAANTKATVEEALRLSKRLARPNVMVKVPGTLEGIPAVRELLELGLNINITLLFSVENYVKIAQTYCEALRARVSKGQAIDKIRSVASFFVSRVDTATDKQLDEVITKNKDSNPGKADLAQSCRGQFGIANSKIAYKQFQSIFETKAFDDLRNKGAAVQRPLWASTGTKDPTYRDVVYIEQLIGPHTVNTMPHATLQALVDHGVLAETLTKAVDKAENLEKQLAQLGVDTKAILTKLQVDGVKSFVDSFHALNQTISKKLA